VFWNSFFLSMVTASVIPMPRKREGEMDVIVSSTNAGATWELTDLLGRSMGHITADPGGLFLIHPHDHAVETMSGMKLGPHPSLDAALAEIERHTRGVCRRTAGADREPGVLGQRPTTDQT
jgi:hypothetical protein